MKMQQKNILHWYNREAALWPSPSQDGPAAVRTVETPALLTLRPCFHKCEWKVEQADTQRTVRECEEAPYLHSDKSVHHSRRASYIQLFIHFQGCHVNPLSSCWGQWVRAPPPLTLSLFHADESHSSGQPGQRWLEEGPHVCTSKQIGIKEEFDALYILKRLYNSISEEFSRAEGGRVNKTNYTWMTTRPAVPVIIQLHWNTGWLCNVRVLQSHWFHPSVCHWPTSQGCTAGRNQGYTPFGLHDVCD